MITPPLSLQRPIPTPSLSGVKGLGVEDEAEEDTRIRSTFFPMDFSSGGITGIHG